MTPDPRPIPRFIASSSQEGIPYGRFEERLRAPLLESCRGIADLPQGAPIPDEVAWFPERSWGGRVWVPATARAGEGDAELEYFGHVSYVQDEAGDQADFRASADFTDVLEDNPDWQIDLNDDVIGRWRGEAGMAGEVTLVWGRPLVPGAVAATAELDGNVVDQEAITDTRFTLVGLDALEGYGDEIYLEIKLWNRRADELASEGLYDEAEEDEEEEPADEAGSPQPSAE
jgi:hypothetical protein